MRARREKSQHLHAALQPPWSAGGAATDAGAGVRTIVAHWRTNTRTGALVSIAGPKP
jgi:hypothetical protein